MVDIVDPLPLSAGEAAAREASAGPHKGASKLGQFAWAVFDGGRSPYNVLVNIFVFSAYFSTVVIPDSVRGQVVWSYTTSTAAFLVAIGAPVLGAIADAGGPRKPWILGTLILGAPCMAAIWFATPGMHTGLIFMLIALVGANLAFEYSAIFCNAMLPRVAPPGRVGFLSGLGFALGNFFGVLLFLFFLYAWSRNAHPLFGLKASLHEPERAVGFLAAGWFVLMAIPLFLFTPDSPKTTLRPVQAVTQGLKTLGGTLAKIGDYRNTALYLLSRMFFNEGFIVMMLFTGVFAAGILHWTPTMLIAEGLINSVVAALAGLFSGWLDTRIGSKPATMVFVGGCLLANVVICSVTPEMVFFVHVAAPLAPHGLFPTLPDKVFLAAQCSAAFFVTGGLVTSRALMAKLAPPAMLTEFFGLFALSGTATSFVGPLAIGLLTAFFHNQRAGVAVGVFFLFVGLVMLAALVRERPAAEA